jgi:hypothetical protein
MTPDRTAPQDRVAGVAPAAVISILGLCLHNVADLDDQYPWSIEILGPAAFLAACLLLWRLRPRLGGALLLAWALLNLLGGAVLSVLPLPFLPFVPEQSLRHYSFHLLYGLTQVPLLLAARAQLKAR